MYKWYSYFIFSFLLLLSIGVAITLFYVKPSDRSYLLELTKKKEEAGLNTHYEGEQLRKQVVKDIWFLPLGKSQRLHFQIKSNFSQLLFLQGEKKREIVENLKEVKGVMQESLEFIKGEPYQRLRVIEAPLARYNYSTSIFEASKVTIKLFCLPGHTLPSDKTLEEYPPFLKGVATRVTFTFKGGTLNFEASNLKAHLLNKEEK